MIARWGEVLLVVEISRLEAVEGFDFADAGKFSSDAFAKQTSLSFTNRPHYRPVFDLWAMLCNSTFISASIYFLYSLQTFTVVHHAT